MQARRKYKFLIVIRREASSRGRRWSNSAFFFSDKRCGNTFDLQCVDADVTRDGIQSEENQVKKRSVDFPTLATLYLMVATRQNDFIRFHAMGWSQNRIIFYPGEQLVDDLHHQKSRCMVIPSVQRST